MNKRDVLLALVVILAWGIHFPVIKIGTNEVPGLVLVTLRFLLTGIIFLPFCRNLSKLEFRQVLIFSGYYYMGHLASLFVALRYLESATVALIMQVQVPFAIIFGWLLYNEKFGWRTSVGLGLSFAGLFFIFGSPDITSFLGLGLTILSSLLWALGSIHMRKIKDVDMPSMTAFSAILAVPSTAIMSLIFEKNQVAELMSANWLHLGFVLSYQIFLMSLMMYLWKELLSRNPVQLVTSFSLLQPAIAVVAAHFMLGESLSTSSFIGGALAMLGVGIIVIRKIQKRQTEDLTTFLHSE
jgi:O-acetylserine/cysteine efflux transporter